MQTGQVQGWMAMVRPATGCSENCSRTHGRSAVASLSQPTSTAIPTAL
jgi:hypothetical protein